MTTDNTGGSSSRRSDSGDDSNSSSTSRVADEHDEKKVKELNREIMSVFGVYKASFGHASASLLSVLSYLSDNYMKQHPESKKILSEYFEKEFDKFLNRFNQQP
ncbi:MAG TPA: hypothetical protein VE818_06425 [Nitrososphaeraceae archaeon]|nr:hypothetical protein [Nitrososphaeraceae archaeon]